MGATQGPCSQKIKICHVILASPMNADPRGVAQTIEIEESEWASHEGHGDFKGECGENPQVTICFNNESKVILVSELATYIQQGAVAGPCKQGGNGPNRGGGGR